MTHSTVGVLFINWMAEDTVTRGQKMVILCPKLPVTRSNLMLSETETELRNHNLHIDRFLCGLYRLAIRHRHSSCKNYYCRDSSACIVRKLPLKSRYV